MSTIPQKELRNHISDVLRRAEAGEEMTITVSGRPVAQLGPIAPNTWVSAKRARHIWDTPAQRGLEEDLERLDAGLVDPFDAA